MPVATDVTLTGTLTDDQGTLLNGTLTFLLAGFGNIMPRIGTTQLVPGLSFQVSVTNGVFNTNFYSNQLIIPGPMITFYNISFQPAITTSQAFTFAQNYSFPAGSFNLAQLNPIAPASIGATVAVIPTSLPANLKSQIFTVNGTFVIPSTNVTATVVGAGASGGGAPPSAIDNDGGGGGGSGAVSVKYLTGLTLGKTLTVTVGVGGNSANNVVGQAGTPSSVSSGTQTITTINAPGGSGGGVGGSSHGFGGDGAIAGTGGDINSGGNPGQFGDVDTGSGGGGGAGLFGGGAPTQPTHANSGFPATGPGAGGGGATNGVPIFGGAGGQGGGGIVIFEWVG